MRLVGGISLLLIFAITATGFISRAYRREKATLGRRHYLHGQDLQGRSEMDAAIEEYRRALVYSPDTAEYRVSFASALLEAGRLEEAQSHVDQLLAEDPTNGVLNLMVARIARAHRDDSKAIDYLQRAVYEYWPPNRVGERRQARVELIELLEQTGRREQLIGELMTLSANFPNDYSLRLRVGFQLLDQGATSEALQVFKELAPLTPRDGNVHRGLAESYFALGDYVSSRHEYERALRLNSRDKVSADELQLTNAVVDLDPNLMGISSAERLRRAQNLLRHVLTEIRGCRSHQSPTQSGTDSDVEETTNAADDPLAGADRLLVTHSSKGEDLTGEMETQAINLWNRRTNVCVGNPTHDTALATVLARLTPQ